MSHTYAFVEVVDVQVSAPYINISSIKNWYSWTFFVGDVAASHFLQLIATSQTSPPSVLRFFSESTMLAPRYLKSCTLLIQVPDKDFNSAVATLEFLHFQETAEEILRQTLLL